MKKALSLIITLFITTVFLCGCEGGVQVFEHKEKLEYKEYKENELENGLYYVKDGTSFAPVYNPETKTFKNASKKIDQSRIVWFNNDEFMLPEHYLGEIVAYKSTDANLINVVLERFEDMGYSFGIYGGKIESDGYYHMNIKDNTIEGSEAQKLFLNTYSDQIRIVTIGGVPAKDAIDEGSGIIGPLKKDMAYTIEFYSGTQYYRANFTADTHFMRPFELYSYNSDYISDTTHGYMCFNTPQNLKSGYYYLNGAGFFKYHAYSKGEVVENEDFNEGFYANLEEARASYSQQYNVNVPQTTKEMKILVEYGKASDIYDSDVAVEAFVQAPDGTEYEMDVDRTEKEMSLSLEMAQAGDWVINIIPKSLEVSDVKVISNNIYEETTCFEQEFNVEEDKTFQMFYAEIEGNFDIPVRGTIINSDGVTYVFQEGTYKDEKDINRRYIVSKLPYMKAGTYTVRIYYYKSTNSVKNLTLSQYDDSKSDVFIIDENGTITDGIEEFEIED